MLRPRSYLSSFKPSFTRRLWSDRRRGVADKMVFIQGPHRDHVTTEAGVAAKWCDVPKIAGLTPIQSLWWSSNTAHRAFHGDQCHQNLLVVGGGGGAFAVGQMVYIKWHQRECQQ